MTINVSIDNKRQYTIKNVTDKNVTIYGSYKVVDKFCITYWQIMSLIKVYVINYVIDIVSLNDSYNLAYMLLMISWSLIMY